MTGDCHVRFCERLRGESPLCLLGEKRGGTAESAERRGEGFPWRFLACAVKLKNTMFFDML
jgi:hypothetical protein